MAFLKDTLLSLAAFGFIAAAPLAAHAIEVECELEDGSTCTVSNDPVDSTSCMCADEGGTGSTGDQEWADFDEEQLMEVCLAEVAFCDAAETDGGTTGMTTTTSPTTTAGDTGDDSTGSSTGGGEGTGEPETTGDTAASATASGGSGPSTNPSDTDSNGTASGGDSDPGTTTGPEPGGDDDGGDGSSGSGADEDSEDPSGCRVDPRGSSGGALLALFGLALGLRRRRAR